MLWQDKRNPFQPHTNQPEAILFQIFMNVWHQTYTRVPWKNSKLLQRFARYQGLSDINLNFSSYQTQTSLYLH